MRTYYIFKINKYFSYVYKNKSYKLYKMIEEIYHVNKYDMVLTYKMYEQVALTFSKSEINSYASEIGYKPHNISSDCNSFSDLPSGTVEKAAKGGGTYCIYKIKVEKSPDTASIHEDMKDEYYYRVLTRIDIQIPIVQNVLGLRILSITGDTKAFELD